MVWQERAAEKRRRIYATIPPEWRTQPSATGDAFMEHPRESGIITPVELAVTESTASEIVQKIATGELSSVAVTTAFCKRAALACQLLNCALEFFPETALARARELDGYFRVNKRTIGPLHGLPISLKDQFRIKGLETTMGYVDWIGKYDIEDSILVTLLYNAGAVLHVKTSVPQTLMVCETVNNIIGRTINPRNRNWSCGGSSGGEGAMVAFRGALIGVGTDIGGSIRVPSAFNFLYGIRPSHGRLPYAKMANSMEGQETVHSVCGPMAHNVADLRLFMTSILAGSPWLYDSKVIPMPWRLDEETAVRSKISSSGLTLGLYTDDGNVQPHPPVLRGLQMVSDALEKAGHTVMPWEPYKHSYAVQLINKIYASDGGSDIYETLNASGEPAIPNFANLVDPTQQRLGINELWNVQLQKWKYQCDYLAQIRAFTERSGKELDAIIAPITPSAAIRHDQFKYYGYASVVNLLDFTSVVVPVTFADKNLDSRNYMFEPLTEMDRTVQVEYDPEAYHGAPVAVQIIGQRLTEEKIMVIAEEIGRLLGN